MSRSHDGYPLSASGRSKQAFLPDFEALDERILSVCTRINSATYELLVMIREFDERGGCLKWGLDCTASHVAEHCRELRMGSPLSGDIAERAFAHRSLRLRRDADRGMLSVTVELPLEAGELIEKALYKARDDECLEVPDLVDTSWSKRQADAFVTMLKEYLQDSALGTRSSSDNYLVNIHVDQSALAGEVGRSSVPIETVKRLCCDGQVVVMTETRDGQPLSIGRKSRVVPKGIERAVRARDKNTCRFPGCGNKRFKGAFALRRTSRTTGRSSGRTELPCRTAVITPGTCLMTALASSTKIRHVAGYWALWKNSLTSHHRHSIFTSSTSAQPAHRNKRTSQCAGSMALA